MSLRPITDSFAVAPQLDPGELKALADSGVTTLICNRPDVEVPPELQAAAMQAAAEAAGMSFVFNPVAPGALNEAMIEEQSEAIAAAEGRAVAYCASGTRSTIVWALGQAGLMATDDILAAAARAGYALDYLRPTIDDLARRNG